MFAGKRPKSSPHVFRNGNPVNILHTDEADLVGANTQFSLDNAIEESLQSDSPDKIEERRVEDQEIPGLLTDTNFLCFQPQDMGSINNGKRNLKSKHNRVDLLVRPDGNFTQLTNATLM